MIGESVRSWTNSKIWTRGVVAFSRGLTFWPWDTVVVFDSLP